MVTNEEVKDNGSGWDPTGGVEVVGRRRVRDHAWRATTETRKENTAPQTVVRHGRSAS